MSSAKLFTPLKVGAITATNRVFMAPLTRLRSIEPGDIPTPLMAEYYRQRASAGLIISEATQISAQAKGYAGAPGLHSDEQIAAWKKSLREFMLRVAIWRCNCGIRAVFHTPACNQADKRPSRHPLSMREPAPLCVTKTVRPSA